VVPKFNVQSPGAPGYSFAARVISRQRRGSGFAKERGSRRQRKVVAESGRRYGFAIFWFIKAGQWAGFFVSQSVSFDLNADVETRRSILTFR